MEGSVFDFSSFSNFFAVLAKSKGKRGGVQTSLAKHIGTHPAYLSRVLKGLAQLSLEQAEKIADFLFFDQEQKRYLLLLLQEERAGTSSLKGFFKNDRILAQQKRLNIKNRIPESKGINSEDQAQYYSSWFHSAIHVLVSIPEFSNVEAISKTLGLTAQTVSESIQFLERLGLIKRKNNRWKLGEFHLHLDKTSPHIRQHHRNWRMKTIQSLDRNLDSDLRYSGVFSLSEKDLGSLREQMVSHLKSYIETVRKSNEEKAVAFCFDFYEL